MSGTKIAIFTTTEEGLKQLSDFQNRFDIEIMPDSLAVGEVVFDGKKDPAVFLTYMINEVAPTARQLPKVEPNQKVAEVPKPEPYGNDGDS